jgi:hypothetical protein
MVGQDRAQSLLGLGNHCLRNCATNQYYSIHYLPRPTQQWFKSKQRSLLLLESRVQFILHRIPDIVSFDCTFMVKRGDHFVHRA